MSAPTNGGPDWALAFAEFHARHRDVKGKKLVFTAIFNAAMESFIICAEVPLVWRVLAWIWRHSWGKDSDCCVDAIGGKPLGQQACAAEFRVDKRRINDCVALLRELHFVLPHNLQLLYPVDDPAQYRLQNSEDKANASPDPSGLFAEFCNEWKVRSLADFQDLESAEATVNRIKVVRLKQYREWLRGRTNHAQPIKANLQQVTAVQHPINEASAPVPDPAFINDNSSRSVVRSDCVPTEPTERPKDGLSYPFKPKIREWLESTFKTAIPGFDLEEEKLDQIAATIHTDIHLKQFQEASVKQKHPRGWKVFVKIALACEAQHDEYSKATKAAIAIDPSGDRLMQMLRDHAESERKQREAKR